MNVNIYVANLAAYNAGELVGRWIELPCDTLDDEIQAVLDAWNDGYGKSEEVAIHDYEAPFDIGEYDDPHVINDYAERLDALNEDDDVIRAIMENACSVEDGLNTLESGDYRVYSGCDDMSDVAYDVVNECGYLDGVPDTIARYFDYESFGRDLAIEGNFISYDGGYIEIIG